MQLSKKTSENSMLCPTIILASIGSGQGKTTVTAALARSYRRKGLRVQVFKLGPDYIDPMLHALASDQPVYQLDLWMTGAADIERRLVQAAKGADIILIEGVMGLFDGTPSTADFAAQYNLPVVGIINGGGMAQTFGALAKGLESYREDVSLYGVVANNVGSDYHVKLLKESLPEGLVWLGHLPKNAGFELPSRHLGLVPAGEVADIHANLDALADLWDAHGWGELPPEHDYAQYRVASNNIAAQDSIENPENPAQPLRGQIIAVARDDAFCFIYPANLDLLIGLGAELVYFSPIAGDDLPLCDALWLTGGYPELHLERLGQNNILRQSLHRHIGAEKPLFAECGGMLYCLETLADKNGNRAEMAGLLRGSAEMQAKRVALGLQEITLPEGTLRGHTFHYARAKVAEPVIAQAANPNKGNAQDAVYRPEQSPSLTASFVHSYFPSNPEAVARLFRKAK